MRARDALQTRANAHWGGLLERHGALAAPDEVLVSRTVSDLVAGSGLRFEERGTHSLKGVPGNWQLLAAA
jgi:class 3 adenylate cyclase